MSNAHPPSASATRAEGDGAFGWELAEWKAHAEKASEYVTIFDENLLILYVNKTQPGVESAVGRSMLDFIAPDMVDTWKAAAQSMFDTHMPQHQEVEATGPNGEMTVYSAWFVPLVCSGRQMGVVVGSDVTHLRRVEEQLTQKDSMLDMLMANTPVYITLLDADLRATFINFAKFNRPEDLVGRTLASFLHADDRERVLSTVNATLDDGVDRDYETTAWVSAERTPETLRSYYTQVRRVQVNGAPHIMLTALDVTEAKRTEAALAESQNQLRQAQKMEAVGQLTGGVAHDFNNLLTVIMGAVDLAAELSSDPEAKDVLREARDASTRAAELTQRLLAFSRKQSLSPAMVDVGQLLRSIVSLLRRTLSETIDLQLDTGEGARMCFADAHQVENAVLNLVNNARDAIVGKGSIHVRLVDLHIDCDDAEAQRAELPCGDFLCIEVKDTGEGMDDDAVRQAFDPFFTTKPVGRGSGLGLSTVYGFAKQSGGGVHIESGVGEGTRVCVYLPAREPAPVRDSSASV